MWKHYHRAPGIQQEAERSHSFVLIHHDIHLSEGKGTNETTHIFKTTSRMRRAHMDTRKYASKNTQIKRLFSTVGCSVSLDKCQGIFLQCAD